MASTYLEKPQALIKSMTLSLYFFQKLKIKYNNFIGINKKSSKIFTSFCKILNYVKVLNLENGENGAYVLNFKKWSILFQSLIKNWYQLISNWYQKGIKIHFRKLNFNELVENSDIVTFQLFPVDAGTEKSCDGTHPKNDTFVVQPGLRDSAG